jgi:hypothetical protein
VGSWSLSLDGNLDPSTGVEWVGLDLTTVWHHSKNWNKNNGKMVLIAQPLLENRTCAYIECLDNELIMTANNLRKYGHTLSVAFRKPGTHKP